MHNVFYAALGIGGTTLIGTGVGFLIRNVSPRCADAVTAFAAGVMLAAASFGLFAPAMDMAAGGMAVLIVLGAACGMLFLRAAAWISKKIGRGGLMRPDLLFVLAIAMHKFPEGMAGGVALNGANPGAALSMIVGISLQNLPEGMVMIPPMIHAGMKKRSAAIVALLTGLLNALGVYAGAYFGRLFAGILPFALAFAGGAMLDVIISQMIPQFNLRLRHGTAVAMGGFLLMTTINALF